MQAQTGEMHDVAIVQQATESGSDDDDGPPPPLQVGGYLEWIVERVIGSRIVWANGRSNRQYLVVWEGYPHEDNSWEPAGYLKNAQQKVSEFWARENAIV